MDLEENIINCKKCERLIKYRNSRSIPSRYSSWTYWNRPVPGYGDINGRLLIIGLAPAFSGGNRTGRIFTGDKSSDFLISSLYEAGFTNIPISENKDDGLIYYNMYITLALKCAPPDNVPLKEELENCSPFFRQEINGMSNLKAILVLGKIAFDSFISYLDNADIKHGKFKFGNKTFYELGDKRLYCSYHPSPRNVNTGILKKADFTDFLKEIKKYIEQ